MRHSWTEAPTQTERDLGVQRCRRCRLKRRKRLEVSFNTGRPRAFASYRWPTGAWFYRVGQPECKGGVHP